MYSRIGKFIKKKTEEPVKFVSEEKAIESKDDALFLISELGYDYSGYNSVPDLKNLIDELVMIARIGMSRK